MARSPIHLRIRNLQSRDVGVAVLETETEAVAWLKARPHFVEVMGMAGPSSVPAEVQERLREAMRPLDDEERLAVRETELAIEKEDLERAKAAHAHEVEAQARHQETMRSADPERLMEIRWRFDSGMVLTDPSDTRTIPDVVREAVQAWIIERNQWVAGRGQTVGECTVKVWPATMPPREEARVKEGRFVPVSTGEK